MTTQVRIEIVGEHNPVMVERSDGLYPRTICKQGESVFEFVHAGQSLTVREVSVKEASKADIERKVEALERLQGRSDLGDDDKQAIQAGVAALKRENDQ